MVLYLHLLSCICCRSCSWNNDRFIKYLLLSNIMIIGGYAECVHRLQHVCEYIIIIISNILEKRKKDGKYSYGYGRHEYLYVFTLNLSVIIVLVLLFILKQMSCFFLFEALHGLSDGHHSHEHTISPLLQSISDSLNYISFIISLITIFGFNYYKRAYHNRYSSDIFRASFCLFSFSIQIPKHNPV